MTEPIFHNPHDISEQGLQVPRDHKGGEEYTPITNYRFLTVEELAALNTDESVEYWCVGCGAWHLGDVLTVGGGAYTLRTLKPLPPQPHVIVPSDLDEVVATTPGGTAITRAMLGEIEGWRLVTAEELSCLPDDSERFSGSRMTWVASGFRGQAATPTAVYRTKAPLPAVAPAQVPPTEEAQLKAMTQPELGAPFPSAQPAYPPLAQLQDGMARLVERLDKPGQRAAPEPAPEAVEMGPIIALQEKDLPRTGVTEFRVARLYNTGRYEHSRYELVVCVGPEARASDVFRNLEQALDELDPTCPVEDWDLERSKAVLAKPAGELNENDIANLPTYRERVKRFEEWNARRHAAIARLDELGKGSLAQEHKDRDDKQIPF